MKHFTSSVKLKQSAEKFLDISYYTIVDSLLGKKGVFYGWGRKKSGQKAIALAQKHHTSFVLLEDGFIRSVGLGVEGSPTFSLVEDDTGIYYDATVPSKLENTLATYDFASDDALMHTARQAIALIKKHKISKYNNAPLKLPDYLKGGSKKVLIVAQTAGDASLKYGLASQDPQMMIRDAKTQYPDAEVYVKVHPDVLAGKKESNVDVDYAKVHCKVITENINPIVLLEAFDAVYTQTSQMGFEALLMGKKVHLYGMPFYAGWGLKSEELGVRPTEGTSALGVRSEEIEKVLNRRTRNLSVEEVFAGAYILYTRYYNPYADRESDIIDTIEEIVRQRALKGSI